MGRRKLRLGIRGTEVAGVTLLTVLAVGITTAIHLSQVSRIVVEEATQEAALVAKQVYTEARRVLAAGGPPSDALRQDVDFRRLIDATLAYSPDLLDVFIADDGGRVIVHSDPAKERAIAPRRPPLATLLALDPVRRFAAVYGSTAVYEATLPLRLDGRPFGSIRLGVSTTLLRQELLAALRHGVALAGVALPVAWLVGLALASVVLRPIRVLRERVEGLRRREFGTAEVVGATGGTQANDERAARGGELVGARDEVAALDAHLGLLGREIESDRLAMLSEKTRLQRALDLLGDAFVVLDADGRVLFGNAVAESVIGSRLADAVGEAIVDVLDPEHALQPLLRPALAVRSGFSNVTVDVHIDGRPRRWLVSLFFVRDSGTSMGAVLLLKDLDSVEAVRSLVTYSAKLAELGRLTSGIAHEVKNPLNAMAIHLELVRERLQGSPEFVQQSLDTISSEIGRLDRVVQGFLKFVRPHDLNLKPLDLKALAQEVVALLDAEWRPQGVRFEVEHGPAIPLVRADEDLLRQALVNVVLNACQAMPAGGLVRVTIEREGESVAVRIADQGVGIAREDLDKIFRLYYTSKADGTGIGLALVYRIVQMHDGRIDVQSTVGRGTTVTLRFPVGQHA